MARRKQHVRSPHRGVIIVERKIKSGIMYSARYKDPLTGKVVQKVIDSVDNRTDQARRMYCILLSENIHRKLSAIGCGDELATHTPIKAATAEFIAHCVTKKLRPATVTHYRYAMTVFEEWAAKRNLNYVEKIRKADLDWLQDFLLAYKKTMPRLGGRVGDRVATEESIAKTTITGILKPIKIMCRRWRAKGWLKIELDDVALGLKLPPAPKREIGFLEESDCRKLLEAALAHDAERNDKAIVLKGKPYPVGSIPKYMSVAPIFLFYLLTGFRRNEAFHLQWSMIDLDASDYQGQKVGEIRLPATVTKTKTPRTVGLEVCPSVRALLAAMAIGTRSEGYVFGDGDKPVHNNYLQYAIDRLISLYGVREFSLQNLRQTTSTFLTNAPGIYAGASVYRSARQLGHSVEIAEKHYIDDRRHISRDARTLERAMQIEDLAQKVVDNLTPSRA
jgi:integrase